VDAGNMAFKISHFSVLCEITKDIFLKMLIGVNKLGVYLLSRLHLPFTSPWRDERKACNKAINNKKPFDVLV
jgi:hypothetical protein